MSQQPPWQPQQPLYPQQSYGQQPWVQHPPSPLGQSPQPQSGWPPMRQPPSLPHERLSAWWRRQRRGAKFVLGCGGIVAFLLFCSSCSFAAIAASAPHTTLIASPTATMIIQIATDTPTITLKPTTTRHPTVLAPTPTVTREPVPTTRPTQVPTRQPAIVTAKPTSPLSRPTPVPPTPTPCADPCNPWGYNFSAGNLISNPPSNFCNYFNCIASFWDHTNGYVDECTDGTYSHSGGVSGACSHHGGEQRPLYSH